MFFYAHLLLPAAAAADPAATTSSTSTVYDLDDEEATSGPTRSQDDINGVMAKNGWAVSDCYTHHAFKGQTGRLTVEFHIQGDGSVPQAKILSSDLKNTMLENCVVDSVKKLHFSVTNGPEQISTFPILF